MLIQSVNVAKHTLSLGDGNDIQVYVTDQLNNNISVTSNTVIDFNSVDYSEEIIYQITNLDKQYIEFINKIIQKDKYGLGVGLRLIDALGGKLIFHSFSNKIHQDNLSLLDSDICPLLGYCLLLSLEKDINAANTVINEITKSNPLNYKDIQHYLVTFKCLLFSLSTGFSANNKWKGIRQTKYGYILIKDNNSMLTYHIKQIKRFNQYLINNTYMNIDRSLNKSNQIYLVNSNIFVNARVQISMG